MTIIHSGLSEDNNLEYMDNSIIRSLSNNNKYINSEMDPFTKEKETRTKHKTKHEKRKQFLTQDGLGPLV